METMRFHKTKIDLFLRTIFLHSSGPIKQIYTHKHMSLGVITPGIQVYPMIFSLMFQVFINIHGFDYPKSNCIADDIKTFNNVGLIISLS